MAEPSKVTLEDYAFNFPTYGFEISFTGTTKNYSDKLTVDDYITIRDNGYSMRSMIDRMGRKDRQSFIQFFNSTCIGILSNDCDITAAGEIELNEDMKMIFLINTATVTRDGKSWTNVKEN